MYEEFLKKVKIELTTLFKQLTGYKHLGFFYSNKNGLNSAGYMLQYICIPDYIVSYDLDEMKKCDVYLYFEVKKSTKNDIKIHYKDKIHYITFFSDSDATFLTYGQKVSVIIPQLLEEIFHVETPQISDEEYKYLIGHK